MLAKLRATGHEIVDITSPQMLQFRGECLGIDFAQGQRLIALSTTALRSLSQPQRRILESHAALIPVEIPTIERIGGGGVRCMLAEIHLPKRDTTSARLQS